MDYLVHTLSTHAKDKQLYAAAFEDIKAIQGATGICTYLEKAPEYHPLLG
jgi:hypothetical protein